ncbi:MFS transporter [Streptomyces sp. CB01881]|uniref:MFS transporter n=1 Tax=Streptomyces sp. CB01881 TaxID=2078691 RepID=UPI0013870E99|nr:MFS transporter [Streptomyces sp. CB01881]
MAEHAAPTPATDSRILRILIASSISSKVADWQLGIVVPLAVLKQTDSVAMSLISFSLRGITYIWSPFLGALIDRFDRRAVFALAQVQQAVCLALLAVSLNSQVSVALLVLLSGFGGVASNITGQFVLIPKLISAPARPAAVAKLNSAIEFSKVGGLLIGGAAFSALGPASASLCIAALYSGAALLALLLPRVPASYQKMSIRRDVAMGFRWAVKPEIIWLVVTMSMTNLAIGQLEPVLVTEFGQQGINAKVISGVMAIGLFAGAVASRMAPRILPAWSPERRILACQVTALAGLVLVATPALPTKLTGYVFECLAVAVSNVASITYRQETIPVEVAGRANATIRMFITGAVPLSGFLFAGASRLDGYLRWLPALGIWTVAVVIWAVYTRHSERLPAVDALEGAGVGDR